MKKSTTTKKEDLIDLFDKDIRVYGKETPEIKDLLKEKFIKKDKDEKGSFYIKK